jgi:hypothetical protein
VTICPFTPGGKQCQCQPDDGVECVTFTDLRAEIERLTSTIADWGAKFLQIRKALGLGLHSDDDLVEVAASHTRVIERLTVERDAARDALERRKTEVDWVMRTMRANAALVAERDAALKDAERLQACAALLKRIRYHAERHALPREWLTAADEVLGTWGPVKLTHSEIKRDAALKDAERLLLERNCDHH